MRVRFTARYDHTFSSRAMKRWPEGWKGQVPRDVGLAAVAAGKAVEVTDLPRNVPKLRKVARAENIELGDARTVDEITTVITAARAALPAEPDSE